MVEVRVLVRRPAEEVFAFVSNWENAPAWAGAPQSVTKTSEGSIAQGTTFHQHVRALRREGDVTLRVTVLEPVTKFGFEALTRFGPIRPTVLFTFEPVEEGARVIFRGDPRPQGPFRLLSPIINRWAQRLWEGNLARLKAVLESEPGVPGGEDEG